jgi:hypothetical protein
MVFQPRHQARHAGRGHIQRPCSSCKAAFVDHALKHLHRIKPIHDATNCTLQAIIVVDTEMVN